MPWAFRQRIAVRKRKLTTSRSTLMRHSLSYRGRLRSSNAEVARRATPRCPAGAAGDSPLGPQMLREPLGGGLRRAVELIGVSREVTAGVELQPLRLAGAVERRQGEVGGADDVDLLSVRRPRRRVIFVTAERELAHVTAMTRAVRIHQMHLHSAMPARDEHN